MEQLYQRIAKFLKENNISGVQLGEILSLKKSPLTDWKNKKSKPTLEQIISICEHFAISSDYLLFGKTIENIKLSSEEIQLLSQFRVLSKEDKEDILCLLEAKYNRMQGKKETKASGE